MLQSIHSRLKGRFGYITATSPGCPFVLGVQKTSNGRKKKKCGPEYQKKRYESIPKEPSIIVVAGRMPLYLHKHAFDNREGGVERGTSRPGFETINGESFEDNLVKTYSKLLEEGHRLIIVYPIPEVGWHVPKRLFKLLRRLDVDEAGAVLRERPITTSYEVYLQRTKSSFDFYGSLEHPNVFRVYPHLLFCDTERKGRCVTHNTEDVFYSDDDHLSFRGAELVAEPLYKAITKAATSIAADR